MESILQKHFSDFKTNPSLWSDERYKLTYGDIKRKTIIELAECSDYVCRKMYQESPSIWREFCESQMNSIRQFSPREMLKLGNPTSLANLAFIALKGPYPEMVIKLQEILVHLQIEPPTR